MRHQLQKLISIINNWQKLPSQLVPLSGMLIKESLTAATTLFQSRHQVTPITRPIGKTIELLLKIAPQLVKKPAAPIQSIIAPGTLPLDGSDACIGENSQVAGDSRLAHGKDGGQFLYGEFTVRKDAQ